MKIRSFNLILIYCSICICLSVFSSSVWGASYTFTRILDVTGYNYAEEPPMINNQGTVYFRAQENAAGSMLFYVKPYYQNMSTYIWTHESVENPVFFPVMNDCNQVAFKWSDPFGGIARARLPGSPTEMVLDDGSYPDSVLKLGNMNNSGHIVFKGESDSKYGIYKCTAPLTIEMIVQEDGTTEDFNCFCINNTGEIAYHATLQSGSQVGTISTVFAETPGDFFTLGFPSINDSGTVAFYAMDYTTVQGIYTCSGSASPSSYVDNLNDGIVPYQSYRPDINNQGKVAYLGSVGATVPTILTGPDADDDKVIAVGDLLDGSTVTDLSIRKFNGHFFNDYGQVVFSATLANGNHAFYRADPEGLELPRSCSWCPAIYFLLFSETP